MEAIAMLLIAMVASLPAVAWWSLIRQRLDQRNALDQRRNAHQDIWDAMAGTGRSASGTSSTVESAGVDEQLFRGVSDDDSNGWLLGGEGLFDDVNNLGDHSGINPATGLPMLDSAIDVAGNPYGFDLHHDVSDQTMLGMHHQSDFCFEQDLSSDLHASDFMDLYSVHHSFVGGGSSWID